MKKLFIVIDNNPDLSSIRAQDILNNRADIQRVKNKSVSNSAIAIGA
jgi:hypothetical protein